MIVVRDVFQAKYGRGDELVATFKEIAESLLGERKARVLTDLSGSYFTVILETEAESLAEWEQWRTELFAEPEFAEWFARTVPLVESGRREFWTVAEWTEARQTGGA